MGEYRSRDVRGNTMTELRLEDVFHVSENWGGGDNILGWVTRSEDSGEILGTYEGKEIMDKNHFGFLL